ncbi:MAG: hypothetical protein IKU17_00065 [Clostridia bacterium]|nr:hypothetical protein [Clostridia bacterium]
MQYITAYTNGIARKYASFPGEAPGESLFAVPYLEVTAESGKLVLELDFLQAAAGEEGYYTVPYTNGCFLTRFLPRENAEFTSKTNVLQMTGAKLGDTAWLVSVEGMKYEACPRVKVENGRYTLSLVIDLDSVTLYEDICLRVVELTGEEANYAGIARAYRRLQEKNRQLVPLAERAGTSSVLSYGMDGMPIIRVRMGWKPAPPVVQEQTPENEPPMHVACTFDDVGKLMDELHAQGVKKAEFCLVGWNIRGHDGRWPQIFPVEEACGGEEGLRRLIAHGEELGYRVCSHTNLSDAYSIADTWDREDIIRKKNGEISINNIGWSGGRMYHLCPEPGYNKHLLPNLPKLQGLGFCGFQYIDVLTIVPPRTCYHPEHPLTAAQCAEYWSRMLKDTQTAMGGCASEGAMEFAAENLDFALYVAFNLFSGRPALSDEPIPLWQLVYHGYVLSNPSAETVNYAIKNPENRLKFYEYGGVPAFYVYSKFKTDGHNWMGQENLFCSTDEERKTTAENIRRVLEEYAPFAEHAAAHMEDHRQLLPGVYETVYSDGGHVIVNYNENAICVKGRTVPGLDMVHFTEE